jgi:hypothetical protein
VKKSYLENMASLTLDSRTHSLSLTTDKRRIAFGRCRALTKNPVDDEERFGRLEKLVEGKAADDFHHNYGHKLKSPSIEDYEVLLFDKTQVLNDLVRKPAI